MPVTPPRPKMPPLNALRAFEAAARLGGFSNAADELCVTAGAISQHIKTLEDWAGTDLFERRSQGVRLTNTGVDVINEFTVAFDNLGHAVRSLRGKSAERSINIAALPSVAQLWLSPRLPKIRDAISPATLSVTALESPPNLHREIFDISVFFGIPKGTDTEVLLAHDMIFPVCSPEIAKRLHEPQDLRRETLLHDTIWADDWALWTRHVSPNLQLPTNGPRFSLFSIAMEETKNGAGVLMGHETLVRSHLNSGELVAPFKHKTETGNSLTLEYASKASLTDEVRQAIRMLSKL